VKELNYSGDVFGFDLRREFCGRRELFESLDL
jgi:hypothetical protein